MASVSVQRRARKRPSGNDLKHSPRQYVLRFEDPRSTDVSKIINKPHLIYREGRWRLFVNSWKSQWRDAASITAETIPGVTVKLAHSSDRWKFGWHLQGKNYIADKIHHPSPTFRKSSWIW